MRGLPKSKSVSWATEDLCQVRLFLSEDTPSQAGINTQEHLQPKKKTQFLYSNTGAVPVSGQAVPPGFEGVNTETQFLKNKLAQLPLPKWKCPPRFLLDPSWRVTAGEGSTEVETENQRELRVFEAIYPRPSDIPLNPAVSSDAVNIICDDSKTPVVPITAIEDEDEEVSNGAMENGGLEECAQQPQLLAAASAALSSVFTGQNGGLIDHELLLKILSNPEILQEFKRRRENPSSGRSTGSTSSQPVQIAPTQMDNSGVKCSFYPLQLNTRPPVTSYHQHPFHRPVSVVPPPPPPPKDISYYKNLIQQHGGDRQQEVTLMGHHGGVVPSSDSLVNATRPVMAGTKPSMKPRFTKPCVYFNSPKGCRNGAHCAFVHEAPTEMPGSKRMKMSNREMTTSQPFS